MKAPLRLLNRSGKALQANPKLLRKAFKEQLPSIKGFGLATKYRAFLKEKYVKYAKQDRPDKEGVIFELLLLFKVVESVYSSVKEQKQEQKRQEIVNKKKK